MTQEEIAAFGLDGENAQRLLESINREMEELRTQAQTQREEALAAQAKEFALEAALTRAGAKNNRAVRAFLSEDLLTYEGGKLCGLEEQLQALRADEETSFLFQTGQKVLPGVQGAVPGEGSDGALRRDFSGMSYEEIAAAMKP